MLLLASKSPRRRQLLEQMGIAHGVLDVDVPEQRAEGESALDYVSRVAHDKALGGLAVARAGDIVMAADTEVGPVISAAQLDRCPGANTR